MPAETPESEVQDGIRAKCVCASVFKTVTLHVETGRESRAPSRRTSLSHAFIQTPSAPAPVDRRQRCGRNRPCEAGILFDLHVATSKCSSGTTSSTVRDQFVAHILAQRALRVAIPRRALHWQRRNMQTVLVGTCYAPDNGAGTDGQSRVKGTAEAHRRWCKAAVRTPTRNLQQTRPTCTGARRPRTSGAPAPWWPGPRARFARAQHGLAVDGLSGRQGAASSGAQGGRCRVPRATVVGARPKDTVSSYVVGSRTTVFSAVQWRK